MWMMFVAAAIGLADESPLKSWQGIYEGKLVVNAVRDPKPSVPITLEIKPSEKGELIWRTTYLGEKKMVKDYILKPTKDATTFDLDEKNGIVLPSKLHGQTLTSTFEVGGTLLVTRYELKGKTITLEILTYGKPTETNGVKTFPLIGIQSAELTKPTTTDRVP